MRKRNFLILLLLSRLWPVIGVSAQDAWKITAGQIEPSSYYGIPRSFEDFPCRVGRTL